MEPASPQQPEFLFRWGRAATYHAMDVTLISQDIDKKLTDVASRNEAIHKKAEEVQRQLRTVEAELKVVKAQKAELEKENERQRELVEDLRSQNKELLQPSMITKPWFYVPLAFLLLQLFLSVYVLELVSLDLFGWGR